MNHRGRRAVAHSRLVMKPSFAFTDSWSQVTTSSTNSRTLNIGTAHAKRIVIVAYSTLNNDLPTSLTINGVSATLQASVGASFSPGTQVWYAAVPTGTSVTISWSGRPDNTNGQYVGVYAGYPDSSTPVDSGTDIDNTSATIANLEIVNGGFAVIAAAWASGSAPTNSWTGADSISNDAHEYLNSNTRSGGSAHILTTESTTTDDFTMTEDIIRIAAVSWGA